ncbi:hypothetical protein NDU88_000874 [Pleurodeles waltl]|uniref:Retrotransposon gag domain-containing protein n=1 Tax=Pleurodeles waltl TaxID=8319 RepID=A0AAV7N9C2_PLEWA|nr:hypothetical protein NDU88_000874 [Pleurodeles waltl]
MAWAYLCWRDGGGLVISSLSLTADVAPFSGGRVFGGLAVVGQNDSGGLPRPRRCNGGLLTGEGEASDVEDFPPPILDREPRVPQTLSPQVIVRDVASLTGESNSSASIEGSLNEDDLLLARLAKRLALERQILAIERERQEMGLGPINGGSNINRVRDSPGMLKIPKGIVTKYEDGDDITKWFTAFERARATRKVNRSPWGALLWEMFTRKCRDRFLTLSGKDAESYDLMKATLIEGFGFSTEEYRIRFRGGSKILEPDLG